MCPSDWTQIGNRCFRRIDALATWRESLAECQQFSPGNGSLASIHSAQDHSVFSDFLGANEAWIGLNDIDNEGFHVWADGSSFAYSKLRSEGNISSLMKILHSCVAAKNDSWKARNCVDKMQSVCVIPAILGRRWLYYHSSLIIASLFV